MPAIRLTSEEVARLPCSECGLPLGTPRDRAGGCDGGHPAPCSVCGKVAMFLGWGDTCSWDCRDTFERELLVELEGAPWPPGVRF